MTLKWTQFAKNKLSDIFDFFESKANIRVAGKLTEGIIEHTKILKKSPEIGQIEELLQDRPQTYRYLVYKNYKIIYWINHSKNRIEISTGFDTRQNPTRIETFE